MEDEYLPNVKQKITPNFSVDQDEQNVYVKVKLPFFLLVRDYPEVWYEDKQFFLSLPPYFLRLEFPCEVQSSFYLYPNGNDKIPYSTLEAKEYTFPVPKKVPGEHFPNLHLLKKLLYQPKSHNKPMTIKVLKTKLDEIDHDNENNEHPVEFDWSMEQVIGDFKALMNEHSYGFANSHSGIVEKMYGEANGIFDIENPAGKTVAQRRKERLIQEADKFDENYYLADLYENDEYRLVIDVRGPWEEWEENNILTKTEKKRIKRFPKREFPEYDETTRKALMLGICDILFAYAHVTRIHKFETNVETARSLVKISPTLSSFEYWIPCDLDLNDEDKFKDMMPKVELSNMISYTIACCARRALVYSLIRNWEVVEETLQDVHKILELGRDSVLKCFLDIRNIMAENGDNYHVLNELYLTDYCCWIKQQTNEMFEEFAESLLSIFYELDKEDVGLELKLLEKAANLAQEEYLDEDDNDDDGNVENGQNKKDRKLVNKLKYALGNHSAINDDDSDDEPILCHFDGEHIVFDV